jgi:aquaporin NIP
MRALCAEFVGTFILVFAGTGSIVVDATFSGSIGHVGISLVFGLAVAIGIVAFAEVSGAHFNPAVTLGLGIAKRFGWSRVPIYIVAQCAGAVSASVVLRALFPHDQLLGATLPVGGVEVAFCFEVLLTFILVATILGVAPGGRHAAALAIGGAVAMDALFGGPVSGASMNPARSFGPALISGVWTSHWLYWLAPIVGGGAAAWTFAFLFTTVPNEET